MLNGNKRKQALTACFLLFHVKRLFLFRRVAYFSCCSYTVFVIAFKLEGSMLNKEIKGALIALSLLRGGILYLILWCLVENCRRFQRFERLHRL